MSDIKKHIRHIFWLFFILFISVTGYFLYFIFFVAPNIANNTLNPRIRMVRPEVRRGEILDSQGVILAYSDMDGMRHYPFGAVFAHVVGHVGVGHSGVEERYNFGLTHLSNEIWQRTLNIARDQIMLGDSITLTLDSQLQTHVHQVLGTSRGSVVVMQPSTGEILAMVSYPTYDPNTAGAQWSQLIQQENSPLINRATQGLYPPGSTFKTLTAAVALNRENMRDFVHHCMGYLTINGETIRCFHHTAHGDIDMTRAFAVSCNTFFVALAHEIGTEDFVQGIQVYFEPTTFSLAMNQSQFNLTKDDPMGYLMQTSIGQGQTLMTPLHMTLLTSAVANGGIMHQPAVVNNQRFFRLSVRGEARLLSHEQAEVLQEMMIQVVNAGTGAPASVTGYQLAGKTGTAENDTGASHGWFTGFVVDQDLAITVMLENSGGTAPVLPMVRNIMNFALGD